MYDYALNSVLCLHKTYQKPKIRLINKKSDLLKQCSHGCVIILLLKF